MSIPANQTKVVKNPNIHMTYKEISEVMGISVQEVKDLEKSALKKMRHPRVGQKLKKYIKN
jgi:DNA-directed RNA polymerase sigma subunit (sigma70/sigma32)